MKHRNGWGWAMALTAAVFTVTAAQAQGPGGGGFQPSPQMMAKFKAWQKWRDNHKNISALQQTLGGIQAMEQDPRTKLNKTQARTVLAILSKWHTKPVMSDAQARAVNQQITTPLNLTQIKMIVTASQRRRGFGGGQGRPGGGQGRPGGGGRPGGFNPASMPNPKDYNPLNPSSLPFERTRARSAQRLTQLMAQLKQTR